MAVKANFAAYVAAYINKKNPATGKIWKQDDVKADGGIANSILDEWYAIVKTVNEQTVEDEGRIATDEELIAAYEAEHPNQYPIATPFGVIYRTNTAEVDKTIGELSIAEFTALMKSILEEV
jgi:hypothetical protein